VGQAIRYNGRKAGCNVAGTGPPGGRFHPAPPHRKTPAPMARPAPRRLLPREHGAWGQLLLPLAAALAMGRPAAAAWLLAAAAVLLFVAHEPLLVLLGRRGERARAAEGGRAARWLGVVAGLGAVAGAAGLLLAPPAARLAAVLPALLAAAVAALLRLGLEKTVAGEVTVAAALSSAAAAVALAGAVAPAAAAAALCAWVVSFAAATLAVHAVLGRSRSGGAAGPRSLHAAGVAALWVLAAALWRAGLPAALPLAAAPTAVLALATCLAPVPPRRLRELGWAFVATSAAALAVLVAGLR
jgi:hypothetical protein